MFSKAMKFISKWKKYNGNFDHESICTFVLFREDAELSALNSLVNLQRRKLITGRNGEYEKKKCGRPNMKKYQR